MKTTLNLDDDLLACAKALAAIERNSLTRLIEEGLSLRLRKADLERRGAQPGMPVLVGGAGLRAGIDPSSNSSLLVVASHVIIFRSEAGRCSRPAT